MTFAWDGKKFQKKLDDLIDNTPPPAQVAAPQKQVAQNGAQGSSLSQQDKQGPGVDIGGEMRGCQPGDSSPAGTVADGMKKIVMATPFGSKKFDSWRAAKERGLREMKKSICVFLFPMAMLAADRKTVKQPEADNSYGQESVAKHNARRAAAPKPATGNNALQLPKDAKQIAPFTWSSTDSNGKKWIYRKTPFGLVRSEDKPEAQPSAESKMPVTFTDQGDSFKFNRKSPFGVTTWVKKKTDLNDEEKQIVENGQPQSGEKR